MSLFSFFSRRNKKSKHKNAKPVRLKARLNVEILENRLVPSGTAISGYVFADANNNGIYDPGESPIANAPVQLRDANNNILGNTTTDANGFYQFNQDTTVNATPLTLTKTLSFPTTQTDYSLSGGIDQFDPSLGQLQSVQITNVGSITSDISVENTSTVSPSVITGTVAGSLELKGPGVDLALSLSQNAGTFNASPFDGSLDYGGTSGTDFGAKQASGTKSVTLTGADLTPFIGTGQVSLTENAAASSSASGGGNLNVSLDSSGMSTVTVTYTYVPSNALKPGNYQVIQTTQPPGFTDGMESSGGVVVSHQPNVDVIPVTLDGTHDSTNNDFGKLTPAGISGYVYFDANNNGLMDPGETGITGSTITLTGTNDLGAVSQTATTDAHGFYQFTNLRPGTYTVQQSGLTSWLDGKDTAGSLGGTVTQDQIAGVSLASGASSSNNNFGELKPAALSGYVYFDANNNGIKEAGEAGIPGYTVTLTGNNDLGVVSQTAVTDANGFYQFTNLRPGTYTVQQSELPNWIDGKDSAGSLGGIVTQDQIANVTVPAGAAAVNNNFGELEPSSLSGYVYADANNNGVMDPGEAAIAGTTITLTGTNSAGPVSQTITTDANGHYQFANLTPGTYVISETQPASYLNGKDAIGSQGGTQGNDVFSNISLAAGVNGVSNNFGELVPAGLSGYVYVDANNNGVKDPGEAAVPGTTITLTGFNDQGPISQTATTDANGYYQFQNLRPGNYALTATQPANYLAGKDTVGSQGGTTATNNFSNIALAAGVLGVNNNFGEVLPAVADLGIVKTASSTSVLVGSNIDYTLTVTNYGTSTSQNVQVIDSLPADGSYQNTTGTGWTITQVNGTVTAMLPSLAAGAASQLNITIKAPAVADTLVNTATVSAATPDNNPNNNTSTVTVTVYNQPPTVIPQGTTPLVTAFGQLPPLGKIQLFGVNTTSYINPTLLGEMTYVSGAYETFLGRAPTQTEFWAAVGQLQAGTSTAAIATNLMNSSEHRAQEATTLYQTFLNRAPSAAELAIAVQTLQSGTSEINFSLNLVNSTEYLASHPTPSTIVAGLYASILNEVPDTSTQLQAAGALANQSVSAFAQSLLTSAGGLGTIVNDAYLSILRRSATQAEIQSWVTQLQANQVTVDQMEINLMSSPEFYQLALKSTKV